jgi:histidine ammonia-lyase
MNLKPNGEAPALVDLSAALAALVQAEQVRDEALRQAEARAERLQREIEEAQAALMEAGMSEFRFTPAAAIRTLLAELEEYGRHTVDCPADVGDPYSCKCGWEGIRWALKG